ncbi:MAG: hypothetical protein K9M03_00495 [Kiritimatiellales bacterium]|nr:hypothetical protein [Kiritimatiellales bacterium]
MRSVFRSSALITIIGFLFITVSTAYAIAFLLVWAGFGIMFYPIYRKPCFVRDISFGYLAGIFYWVNTVNSVVAAYGWEMFLKMIFAAGAPWAVLFGAISITTKLTKNSSRKASMLFHLIIPTGVWLIIMQIFHHTAVDSFPVEAMFYQPLPLIQTGILGGMELLVVLVLAFNIAFGRMLLLKDRLSINTVIIIGCIVLCVAAWGGWRLFSNPQVEGNAEVTIVQTNYPMNMQWRVDNSDLILSSYTKWANEVDTELVIFPQYNLSGFLNDEETISFFTKLSKDSGKHIILGTYTSYNQDAGGQFNVAYSFSPTKGLDGSYNAGVNLPFREVGEVFDDHYEEIDTPIGRAGIILCYEDAVRHVAKSWAKLGVDYLIVLSNPSTFASPIIHNMQDFQDRVRAVETGLDVIRVSANGPSAVIDSFGRYRVITPGYEQVVVKSDIATK